MDAGGTELVCTTIVYRAVTRASDFDKNTQKAKPTAFHRRSNDKKGLSVDYGCEPHEAGTSLGGRRAILSLHVGRVRMLGIDVVRDVTPNAHGAPPHANITGVPFRDDKTLIEKAEQLAADLAEQARPAHVF